MSSLAGTRTSSRRALRRPLDAANVVGDPGATQHSLTDVFICRAQPRVARLALPHKVQVEERAMIRSGSILRHENPGEVPSER